MTKDRAPVNHEKWWYSEFQFLIAQPNCKGESLESSQRDDCNKGHPQRISLRNKIIILNSVLFSLDLIYMYKTFNCCVLYQTRGVKLICRILEFPVLKSGFGLFKTQCLVYNQKFNQMQHNTSDASFKPRKKVPLRFFVCFFSDTFFYFKFSGPQNFYRGAKYASLVVINVNGSFINTTFICVHVLEFTFRVLLLSKLFNRIGFGISSTCSHSGATA